MEISVIGVNHRTAPVEIRERFSLPDDLARRLLHIVCKKRAFEEAMVLSTCNRTEIYFVHPRHEDPLHRLLAHVAELRHTPPIKDISVFYRYDGLPAVAHLFRVMASLDSQIVGEREIVGQVKNAYRLALEARSARFLLNKLLHWGFRVSRRVRTDTDLRQGSASVPQAAVALARKIFSTLNDKTAVLVGAGQTAELTARSLLRSGVPRLIVANRTVAKAQQLAQSLLHDLGGKESAAGKAYDNGLSRDEMPCTASRRSDPQCYLNQTASPTQKGPCVTEAIGLNEITSVIGSADLLICSTSSPDCVLTHDDLSAQLSRRDQPLLIVDIAVPRDVDSRLGRLSNVFLFNIDELDRIVAQNIERRGQEIPRAEAIVDWEVQQFGKWLDSLQVVPTIKLLQRYFGLQQEEQIRKYGKEFAASSQRELEQFAQSLCKKILHQPLAFLREVSTNHATTDDLAAIELIRRMFDLDSLESDK